MAMFFIVLSTIAMILTGGCTLIFLSDGAFAEAALVLGGVPFLISAGICFLAVNVRKKQMERAAEREADNNDDAPKT